MSALRHLVKNEGTGPNDGVQRLAQLLRVPTIFGGDRERNVEGGRRRQAERL